MSLAPRVQSEVTPIAGLQPVRLAHRNRTILCDDCLDVAPAQHLRSFPAAAKILVLPVGALLLLTTAAMAGEAWSENQERMQFPAPGSVVDIGGGQLMHLRVWGEAGPGRPTLLLMAGAAIPSSAWAWIGPSARG